MKDKQTIVIFDSDEWIKLEAGDDGVTVTCHDERVTSQVRLTWKLTAELTKFIREANFERLGDTQDLVPVHTKEKNK